jgi:hypothetical protein
MKAHGLARAYIAETGEYTMNTAYSVSGDYTSYMFYVELKKGSDSKMESVRSFSRKDAEKVAKNRNKGYKIIKVDCPDNPQLV